MAGLEDEDTQDREFKQKLSKFTKLEPKERIEKTNEFVKLLTKDEKCDDNKMTSKEKADFYGIEIKPNNERFKAYYMKPTKLVDGKNKEISEKQNTFPVYQTDNVKKWLCIHYSKNFDDAVNLTDYLQKASKAFGIKISDPDYEEMDDDSKPDDWVKRAEMALNIMAESEEELKSPLMKVKVKSEKVGESSLKKKSYDLVVFLISNSKNNNKLYAALKRHSLFNNGYVSQVVKAESIYKQEKYNKYKNNNYQNPKPNLSVFSKKKYYR